jgi:eukaryotic-like serine/threonine-protein kinase
LKQEGQPRGSARAADPYAGQCLGGRYDVLFRLGAGGDAVVYAARDREADRKVALKLLPGRDAASAASAQARLHEARRLGSGDDPRLCEVIDAGLAGDGTPFFVLDLLAGRSAAAALAADGSFEPARAVEVAWRAASALASAHALGVVHGAVDPTRVWLVGRAGAEGVKVIDFGAARAAAASGAAAATAAYVAPEVLLGRGADACADVYAVGVLLYELLAGVHPFAGLEGDDLLDAALHVDPEPVERVRPSVGPSLAAIVSKATARDPVQRFASMEQLVAALGDLRPALAPRAAPPEPEPPVGPATRPPRRRGRVVAMAIGAAATLGLGLGELALQRARRAEPAAAPGAEVTPAAAAPSSTPASTPTPTSTSTSTSTATQTALATATAPPAPPPPAAIAPALLQAIVQERRSAIDGCIAEDPRVGGRMMVEVRARADGTFAGVTPRSGGSRVVQRCIAKVVQGGRIPAPGREAVGAVAIDLD